MSVYACALDTYKVCALSYDTVCSVSGAVVGRKDACCVLRAASIIRLGTGQDVCVCVCVYLSLH